MQRQSKKRQAILDCLRSVRTHPSADDIYVKLKSVYPDLSLATVYRNLNMLKEEGIIRSVGTVDGEERFDGFTHDHAHAICKRCGAVIDIENIPFEKSFLESVSKAYGFEADEVSVTFTGSCKECKNQINETSETEKNQNENLQM